jgi:HD-GYP domain-containing protein (c-di-GMP phosphodiesterase class II)
MLRSSAATPTALHPRRLTSSVNEMLTLDFQSAKKVLDRHGKKNKCQLGLELNILLKKIHAAGRSEDTDKIELITSFSKNHINYFGAAEVVNILIEASITFDTLGNSPRALYFASEAMKCCNESLPPRFTRRAHNMLAVCHFRLFNFELSCAHLHEGLKIAIANNDIVGRFAVLANVVALLEAMGLMRDAMDLSLEMLNIGDDTQILNFLHFQNAINGAKIAKELNNELIFIKFHRLAIQKLDLAGEISNAWRAQHIANHTFYLTRTHDIESAKAFINDAVSKQSLENVRVVAILFCAEALCNISIGHRAEIVLSARKLRRIIPATREAGVNREEVLRVLVQLYSKLGGDRGQKIGLAFLRQLREHYVSVKHKQFFCQTLKASNADDPFEFSNPEYDIPAEFSVRSKEVQISRTENITKPINDELDSIALGFAKLEHNYGSRRRTRDYDIAENWAVAAEIAAGRTGRHCFQVGRLAGLIAVGLEWNSERCASLELACRLHDVGNIAIDSEMLRSSERGEIDSYSRLVEHTLAGGQLLSVSSDPLLRLSATIALFHHEWWNAAGSPQGIGGEGIPIEARICSVADAFFSLIDAPGSLPRWGTKEAVNQVLSMAGVQLDPSLMNAFVDAITSSSFRENRLSDAIELAFDARLVRSKLGLSNVLASTI